LACQQASGERNPQALAQLKNERIQASRQEIAQSLEGNWRPQLLFVLEQSLALYDTYHQTDELVALIVARFEALRVALIFAARV
jgi:hypothetical protein